MLQHAKKGGDIEVMGYFRGKIEGRTYFVLDAFPLPVEGTETRVNAGREAEEYSGRIGDLCEIVVQTNTAEQERRSYWMVSLPSKLWSLALWNRCRHPTEHANDRTNLGISHRSD